MPLTITATGVLTTAAGVPPQTSRKSDETRRSVLLPEVAAIRKSASAPLRRCTTQSPSGGCGASRSQARTSSEPLASPPMRRQRGVMSFWPPAA